MQSDPIGLDGGINTFGYVEGSPLLLNDMFGLQANINYFKPGTRDRNYGNQIQPIPGTFIIAGHGNNSWIVDLTKSIYGDGVPAEMLVERIRNHKDFVGVKRIIMVSCFVGQDETDNEGKSTGRNYTQDVADGLGIAGLEILAANSKVDLKSNGKYSPKKPGTWITYKCKKCGDQ